MKDIEKLIEIMAALRNPVDGCPWDIAQDFASIAPYTIEEAYEVADAVDRRDFPGLRDELGDLLLQVVFHARMAEEGGHFDFTEVVTGICDKLVRRHPHVFGTEKVGNADAQREAWERIKATEQHRGPGGRNRVLAGVSGALPALSRAVKLGRRASGVGFDWSDLRGVADKVREELAEVESVPAGDRSRLEEEIGDLLFAVANLARRAEVDPEEALRQANRKFERRFDAVEDQVRSSGRPWNAFTPVELEAFWRAAKLMTAAGPNLADPVT